MTASKPNLQDLRHVDQLIFGFTLPNKHSRSYDETMTFNPKMKVVNTVLRWKIPPKTSSVKEDDAEKSPVDTSEAAPLISPCFPTGTNTCPSNWRIHVMSNYCENEGKYLSVFLEFYEYLGKDQYPPSKMNAIYIVRLLDPSGNVLISRRSGIRYFNSERLCYGWKPFVSLKSVEDLLHSGNLRIEVDLTILRCDKIEEFQSGLQPKPTPIVSFPEEENIISEGMESLSLKSAEKTDKAFPKTQDIEWTTIMCNNVAIPDGNKKLMMEKSGYFKKKWDRLLDKGVSKPVLKIGVGTPEIMTDIVTFLNGNVEGCTVLYSDNYDKLEEIYIRSVSFEIPLLKIAWFNAACQLIVTQALDVNQTLTLALRARNQNLHEVEECQQSMVLLRKNLMKHINSIKSSNVMKANREYVHWIAECLFLAE